MDATAVLARIRDHLVGDGWRRTALDRHELEGSTIAVETRYMHNEVTVRITDNIRGRNKDEIIIVRGQSAEFITNAINMVREEVEKANRG